MPSERIGFDVAARVATIVIRQEKVRNALDLESLQELYEALQRADADENVGAVVLTGAGREAFCAGFNLKRVPLGTAGTREIEAHFRVLAMWWHQVVNLIPRMRKPVLAAVNGVAAGGGLGLSLVCDLAVAVDTARFLCAWHAIGIANDTATSYTLAKIVGFRRAMEMMLTNRTLDAREALAWGVLNRVYPASEFSQRVTQIATDLARVPTHLQAMAKDRFHMGWRQSVEECSEFEIRNVLASVAHPHFRKTLEAFVTKQTRSDAVQVRLP
jgi:2-(1,2-epoxy-1,2-dihydrophenyl)acetyl-CoA isomerase